ncbi:MAG: phage terminase large subunit [Fusobacteriaceae bacterium]
MSLEYEPLPIWKQLYDKEWDVFIAIGSRASGKTWNVSNFTTLETLDNFKHRSLILRETKESIEESILKDIKDRFDDIDSQTKGAVSQFFDVQKTQISNKKTKINNILIKGFREARTGMKSDLKGFSGINLVVLEETEDIRDEERVKVLFDTLREKDYKIIIILNTPDLEHWVVQRYFDYEVVAETDDTEYYKLTPKKLKGVKQLITTYKDNPFLTEKKVKEYESYGDKEHYNYDLNHYYKHILGYASPAENLPRKFNFKQIEALRQKALPIKTIKEFTVCPNTSSAKIAKVKFYHNLLKNQYYVLSIDFSHGVGGDSSTIQLRTQDSNGLFRQVATVRDNTLSITQISDLAWQLAVFINSFGNVTILVPEINTPGDTPITYWKDRNYNMDWIYQKLDPDTKQVQDRGLGDYGFRTGENRNAIIDKYKLLLDKGLIEVNDLEELKEMEVFVLNDKGKFEALSGHHDDLLLADFINVPGFEFLRRSL